MMICTASQIELTSSFTEGSFFLVFIPPFFFSVRRCPHTCTTSRSLHTLLIFIVRLTFTCFCDFAFYHLCAALFSLSLSFPWRCADPGAVLRLWCPFTDAFDLRNSIFVFSLRVVFPHSFPKKLILKHRQGPPVSGVKYWRHGVRKKKFVIFPHTLAISLPLFPLFTSHLLAAVACVPLLLCAYFFSIDALFTVHSSRGVRQLSGAVVVPNKQKTMRSKE